ncbi:SusC/RagA family TonB-linked outer membrane protein [Arachidicoccus terrestris]|uniref:SusC/RagA family TonB-linked outer membrane protein n=1 Tax=Arachidicoccus terrestris TaxID=2875539 RepID=UPI001CC6D42C|nr:SusC/RagA family TonB-linked outer membrane protein [Arachidicoccus terrestris]UAY55704.1 SusC/RagA family TonB-linked outer membrane protein [Arachidicoccus terrestris]
MYKIFSQILCRQYFYALKPKQSFRMTIALLTLIFICLPSAQAQTAKISLKKKHITYDQVFREIKRQAGYDVVLISSRIQSTQKVDVNFSGTPLKDVLDTLLTPHHLGYVIQNKTIVIREISQGNSSAKQSDVARRQPEFHGRILDENNKPLIGATIAVKGTDRKTVTDKNGEFVFPNVNTGDIVEVSFVGYNPVTIVIQANNINNFMIQMTPVHNELKSIVITGGGITRNRESFTGAAAVYSGKDLKAIGNQNIIKSLATLDPTFVIVQNNAQGSNPNTAPNIEIRGKTTFSNVNNLNDQYSANPNQPLFILDGFESDLRTIYDLDMNRVASITLLKDAASTALYGSKAANGVVVVETKKPVPGKLQVYYTADLSMDIPDLSSYNLMNASEKLEFEKLAGLYYAPLGNQFGTQWQNDSIYNARLAQVARGVNTDWLVAPVRSGFTERHAVQISGGSKELMVQAGVDFRNQNGVMKGSDRNTWAGNIDITYRKNKVNITNILTVNNLVTNNSPYGSFQDFANANPYYPKNTNSPFLDPGINQAPNPLYNASLYSINQSKTFGLNEKIQGIYSFTHHFRLEGGLQFSKSSTNGVIFIPPDNTAFAGMSPYQQGSYTDSIAENTSYSAYLTASYARVFGKHQITANIRGDIQSTNFNFSSFAATGFPFGTNGNPAFAYGYPTGGRPLSTTATQHTTGGLGSINYAYDGRFLLDATYRLDGASTFGVNNLYHPYYSVGIGWNLHNERFLKPVTWIDMFKLRANVGYTGNENIGQFTSTSVYTFLTGANFFGQGLTLTSLGNPDLDWQNTRQASFGTDFSFLKGRITGYVEYFDKFTSPLAIVAAGALPSSAGANSNYVINVGNLTTRGTDFNVRVSPIYDLNNRIVWTIGIMGQRQWSKYGGLANKLSSLNALAQSSGTLQRYQDGYSPDDIWAVKSAGIDPATGQELFFNKDGTMTFTYDPTQLVIAGNANPTIQGVISSNVAYKGFTLGLNLRYAVGGDIMNYALFNKVENLSVGQMVYNQDRRALYDRWKSPGDVSKFKAITLRGSSPISSRFVEQDSYLTAESFSLGYRIANKWLEKKFGIQALNMTVYTNEIFRVESILSERGTDYPYARTVSFSLNASF